MITTGNRTPDPLIHVTGSDAFAKLADLPPVDVKYLTPYTYSIIKSIKIFDMRSTIFGFFGINNELSNT